MGVQFYGDTPKSEQKCLDIALKMGLKSLKMLQMAEIAGREILLSLWRYNLATKESGVFKRDKTFRRVVF